MCHTTLPLFTWPTHDPDLSRGLTASLSIETSDGTLIHPPYVGVVWESAIMAVSLLYAKTVKM